MGVDGLTEVIRRAERLLNDRGSSEVKYLENGTEAFSAQKLEIKREEGAISLELRGDTRLRVQEDGRIVLDAKRLYPGEQSIGEIVRVGRHTYDIQKQDVGSWRALLDDAYEAAFTESAGSSSRASWVRGRPLFVSRTARGS